MPVIKRPTLDANDMVIGFTDYTTTNDAQYNLRHTTRNIPDVGLAADFYPYRYAFTVTWLEP